MRFRTTRPVLSGRLFAPADTETTDRNFLTRTCVPLDEEARRALEELGVSVPVAVPVAEAPEEPKPEDPQRKRRRPKGGSSRTRQPY